MDAEWRASNLADRALEMLGGIRLSDPEATVMLSWVLAHSDELGLSQEPAPKPAAQPQMLPA